ncbi:MAG: flagellar M-ring protein FliF [Rickettsiales bacterium]|nr:MAG: flagellar M-ring protein FliF [Rickettsiales bacterium]
MQVIIQFFKEMSPFRLAATIGTILTFVVLFVLFISKVGDNELAVLYSDLDLADSGKIAEELDKRKVSYSAVGDGSTIKVHKSIVSNTRLALAQAGLPSSGAIVGYEIFDKEDSIGATNFSQNVKLIRALEGELSRTISAFEQVDKARVHLVMPQREIFSKERLEARASVVLKFKGTKRLGKNEIDAISHLVISSVPDLEMKNITIVDTKGRALKIGSADEGSDFSTGKNEEIKILTENRLRIVIEDLLASTIGSKKVKAQVAVEMNFDRVVTNSEIYDPEGAVIRSTQTIDENDKTPVSSVGGQDASVANNIPGGGDNAAGGGNQFATSEKSDSTTNFEISKTIKNHISESGLITKMSIGILIDGIYETNKDTGEVTYKPRTQEELDKISNLVKVAVGFNEERKDKIEVINMKFASELEPLEDDSNWIKEELPNLFQTLIVAIVVVLVLITVIRPIALKAFEVKKINDAGPNGEVNELINSGMVSGMSQMTVMDANGAMISQAVVSAPVDGDVPKMQTSPKSNPILKVNEIADANPQELVNILRKWLNEES